LLLSIRCVIESFEKGFLMLEDEKNQKKALKIFSATVSQVLGEDDDIAIEVMRAADSADPDAQKAAEAVYDALPREKRAEINDYAVELALVERRRSQRLNRTSSVGGPSEEDAAADDAAADDAGEDVTGEDVTDDVVASEEIVDEEGPVAAGDDAALATDDDDVTPPFLKGNGDSAESRLG
jgi:hypothetical protein